MRRPGRRNVRVGRRRGAGDEHLRRRGAPRPRVPGISDDLFDGYYVERSTRLGDHAIYASTASSPSLVLYHCDDAAKFGAEGAWLGHAFFGDVTDDAALAAEIAACPHLVQWQSGARLAGASRAQNAVATSTTADVTTRTSTVVVTCFAPGPCGAGTAVLSGARVATADADYGLMTAPTKRSTASRR